MRSLIVTGIALATWVACGGDRGNQNVDPPPEPGLPLTSLCAELAKADCKRLERCGQLIAPFDRAHCEVRQKAGCEGWAAAVTTAVTVGELTYFELSAKKCRDRVEMFSCEESLDYDYRTRQADCAAMIGPKRAEGEACTLPSSCNEGLYCDGRVACPGLCRKQHTNNEMCNTFEPCTKDQFCAAPIMRCHARVAGDAPCETSVGGNACVDGYHCDSSQPSGPKCVPVRGRGNGCTDTYQCAVGLNCVNSRCSGGEKNDTCSQSSDCKAGLACGSGVCVEITEPGKGCGFDSFCTEGFACFSKCSTCSDPPACNPRPVLDQACQQINAPPCYQSRCGGSTCVALAADGMICNGATDCELGRECTATECTLTTPDCSGI